MRKVAVALSFVAALGMLAPPAFAQAPAAAPAPKVTINGLVDFVVTGYKNWSMGGSSGAAGVASAIQASDVTDSRDKGLYSRERGVFTITGEIGRSKAVWAIELDFTNGSNFANGGNAFNGGANTGAMNGTSANFDLDTDVASVVETKWLYVETPLTGPGSIMPFIPVSTIVRGGGQPFRGHDYKFGILASGDFPGVAFETAWAPNLRSTITFAQISERLDPLSNPNGRDNWAALASVEWDVFKGLTIKPTYAYAEYRGGNCGGGNLGTPGKGGFNPNSCANPPTTFPLTQHRHTIGGDVRWTTGGFSLQPTVYWQFGEQDISGTQNVDVNAWMFDTIAGYRTGPLNIEGRLMYTSGMKAQHRVQNGANVGYYQPINPGFGYMAGWSDIWTGGVDYISALLVGISGLTLRESPSYDKYGRIFLAGAVDYALTPALTFKALANVSWTAEKVDTDSTLAAATGLTSCPATGAATACKSNGRGKDQFLGTEIAGGLTYRFAPNVAFDLIGAILFAGDALNHHRTGGDGIHDAENVYKTTARVRVTF
jgi:hypothetical protein